MRGTSPPSQRRRPLEPYVATMRPRSRDRWLKIQFINERLEPYTATRLSRTARRARRDALAPLAKKLERLEFDEVLRQAMNERWL